jgi:hypothetical protein
MRTRLTVLTMALSVIALAGTAQAQFFGGPAGGPMMGGFGGGWGYGGPYAGSTVAGSFLIGSAYQTMAAGQAELMDSMASKNYQDAYEHWMENQKLRETTYFDMRRMNASYRAEVHGASVTPEQLVAFSKSRLPDRLSTDQIDAESGQIKWPQVLLRDEFAPERAALEYLFAERATRPYSTGLGTQNYREVRRVTDDMHDILRSLLDVITPDEFIAGNRFLNSVSFEARFEPDTSLVTN